MREQSLCVRTFVFKIDIHMFEVVCFVKRLGFSGKGLADANSEASARISVP
jgi:hypothetical protein